MIFDVIVGSSQTTPEKIYDSQNNPKLAKSEGLANQNNVMQDKEYIL